MAEETVAQFLEEFTAWAAAQPDVQAVALVGSHARDAARPDSDVDLVVIADRPELYVQNTGWIERFGHVERQQTEDYIKLISVRVWYADGREIEYGLTDPSWAALPLDPGSQQVIADGMRVLFERAPLLSRHQPHTD
ncbi:MAG TPA: nucleotidyltransferase domain-containing protein [Herpetosiphonaceae bacterium]